MSAMTFAPASRPLRFGWACSAECPDGRYPDRGYHLTVESARRAWVEHERPCAWTLGEIAKHEARIAELQGYWWRFPLAVRARDLAGLREAIAYLRGEIA